MQSAVLTAIQKGDRRIKTTIDVLIAYAPAVTQLTTAFAALVTFYVNNHHQNK